MKVSGVTKWISLEYEATSLHSVIKDEAFKTTTAGKKAWTSLIVDDSSLQRNCNLEGFNIKKKNIFRMRSYINARIGIVANDQNDCKSCNSCIGFGITARGCGGKFDDGKVKTSTCGNIAICGNLKNQNTAAFGYILVQ
jgi:hypothetical protein